MKTLYPGCFIPYKGHLVDPTQYTFIVTDILDFKNGKFIELAWDRVRLYEIKTQREGVITIIVSLDFSRFAFSEEIHLNQCKTTIGFWLD